VKRALGPEGRAALAACVAEECVLAFDFDGTLAPIVADRARAAMRAGTRERLGRLAARRRCVVISGRAPPDLVPRLDGVTLAGVVGNHGIGWGRDGRGGRAARERVAAWRDALRADLGHRAGLSIEDNGLTVAVHYRAARDRAAAKRRIHAVVAGLAGARPLDGKCVVNVLPENAPHKGDALTGLCHVVRARAALYVGDDVTDEDVFTSSPAPRFVTVRVGQHDRSAAAYYVEDQRGIDGLLDVLLEAVGEPP
jgi:trehalose 6-phosphate phosphatase